MKQVLQIFSILIFQKLKMNFNLSIPCFRKRNKQNSFSAKDILFIRCFFCIKKTVKLVTITVKKLTCFYFLKGFFKWIILENKPRKYVETVINESNC